MPGDTRTAYDQGGQARQILNDAEDDLREWRPEVEGYASPPSEVAGSPALKGKGKEASEVDEAGSTQADLKAAEAGGALPVQEGSKTTEVAG